MLVKVMGRFSTLLPLSSRKLFSGFHFIIVALQTGVEGI